MPIRLGTNIASINARRYMNQNSADFTKRIERLSSGLRINRGSDDAAGLSVSEGMRAQILGMRQGARNATAGINLIQLAEGSLNEVSSMLLRMRELAVQSANSTINDGNRIGISNEFNALNSEIDRVALSTTYNDQSLLTGFGNSVSQDRIETSALDGFSGVTEIGVSGAVPGVYTFTDDDSDDNKITLSVAQIDGTVIEQTIDVGSTLDRSDAGVNLVATGTTFIANFDRLGIQATLVGPGVDSDSDSVKLATSPTADGNLFIGEEVVEISVGMTLGEVRDAVNDALADVEPEVSAELETVEGVGEELQIFFNGHEVREVPEDFLGLQPANAYIDGRLDGKSITIDESYGGTLQVGPNNALSHRLSVNIGDMRSSGPELNLTGLSIANLESAQSVITRIDSAILVVTRQRGDLGAVQNRLTYTTNVLENAIENLSAAESAIRDMDVAEEMSSLTRAQIMNQASTAMLAQANALPQSALQLLQ